MTDSLYTRRTCLLLERYGRSRISFEEWHRLSKASAGEFIISSGVDVDKEAIDKEYEEVYTWLVTRSNDPIRPSMYEAAPSALGRLRNEKNIRLAIVSSHPRANLVRELSDYGILELFDHVSGDPMPKKERLVSLCSSFGCISSGAFFVEDTIYGLRAGYQAGVHCFGITTGYHSRQMLESEGTAYKVVDSLSEIIPLINGNSGKKEFAKCLPAFHSRFQ